MERLARLDARDQEYIESLPESKRTTVVSTILSYWREDNLREGDLIPQLQLFRADDASALELTDLLGDRPVVLVFGSYT